MATLASVAALALSHADARPEHELAYDGDFPDPFVLPVGGGYLAYATNTPWANVPVLESADLTGWSVVGDALPALPDWAEAGSTWAPSVLEQGDGSWVLYFVARDRAAGLQCIGAATAADPRGPFAAAPGPALVCQTDLGGSIDPHVFRDLDGQAVLLWKNDGNCCGLRIGLWSQPLGSDGISLVGSPSELLVHDRAWEAPLIENPALVYADGTYHLLYSGGWWESATYAVGYATCASPAGPCTKVGEGPVLASAGEVLGPGGQVVFTDLQGQHWLAYHAWTAPRTSYAEGGARSLRLRRVSFGDGSISLDPAD